MPGQLKIDGAVRLLPSVCDKLAELHGTSRKARDAIAKSDMPSMPADGVDCVEQQILVINDLHMGAGRHPVSGKFDPGDDFTVIHENQMIGMLERARKGAEADGRDVKLVLNGDVVDFLQTTAETDALKYPDGFDSMGAPKNTPANAMVMLNIIRDGHPNVFKAWAQHLLEGHSIDFIPGNHDLHLLNKHVWGGLFVQGSFPIEGFQGLIRQEMEKIESNKALRDESLQRLRLLPWATYGGKVFVDHGHAADPFNVTKERLKEYLRPSGLHEEMEMTYGDFGVKGGFNALERFVPCLDNMVTGSGKFWRKAFGNHPILTSRLVQSFATATVKEGYDSAVTSKKLQMQQRLDDVAAAVEKEPALLDMLNACRTKGDQLTKAAAVRGLQDIEKVSATPLYANFSKAMGFLERLRRFVTGQVKTQSCDTGSVRRLMAAKKGLGITTGVFGHTHKARDEKYLGPDGEVIRYVNTHTMQGRHGSSWGRAAETWGPEDGGVGQILIGRDGRGNFWTDVNLKRVVDGTGGLEEGDLVADAETSYMRGQAQKEAERIFEKNHPSDYAAYQIAQMRKEREGARRVIPAEA